MPPEDPHQPPQPSVSRQSQRNSRAITELFAWLFVIIAPLLLHLTGADFAPMWGASETPVWHVAVTIAAAVTALALAVHRFRKRTLNGDRGGYYVALCVVTVFAIPLLAIVLFRMTGLLAVLLTLPYAAVCGTLAAGLTR
jgi:hypothetical protein